MENSLKKNSIRGVKWSSISTALNSILIPIFYVILAILLTPGEFAYVAVINLIYRVTSTLVKFGIEEAYIQQTKLSEKQSASLLFFSILISVIISVFLFCISSYIEKFYNYENLGIFLKLLLIAIIADGIESVFRGSLRKAFFFKEWSIILMIRMISRIFFTLISIILGFGAVSIVIGYIASSVISLFQFITAYRKKINKKIWINFNMNGIKSLISFGLPITAKNFFDNLSQRVDEIIIGSLFSSEILGVYFFGKNLIMQIKTAIITSFSMVLLPLYSKIKNTEKALKNTYLTITIYTSIIGMPILVGVSLVADLIIPTFFGEEWIDSVLVIQMLSIAIIFPIIIANNATSLLYSYNKPSTVLIVEVLTSLLYFAILWSLSNSIVDVLVIYCVYLIVKSLLLQFFVNKLLSLNVMNFLRKLLRPAISIVSMIIVVLLFKYKILLNLGDIPALCFLIFIGAFTFILVQLLIDKDHSKKILSILINPKYFKKINLNNK